MRNRVLFLTVAIATIIFGLSRVSAVTGLGVGYYEQTNANIVYTGTWNTSSSSALLGGSATGTTSGAARASFYVLASVERMTVYYYGCTTCGAMTVTANGAPVASVNTYTNPDAVVQSFTVDLPTNAHYIELFTAIDTTRIWIDAIELHAASASDVNVTANVNITAVVSFPTHTPTPTVTPTMTPTTGPSPTPSPTATPTANVDTGVNVGGQDVIIRSEVRPGDIANVAFLVVIAGLMMTFIIMYVRKNSS